MESTSAKIICRLHPKTCMKKTVANHDQSNWLQQVQLQSDWITFLIGAGALCRTASLHQCEHRYCLHIGHLAGDLNVMADDASRLQALSDPAFLSHFELSHSQERPWRLLRPTPAIVSRLISDVLGKRPPTLLPPRLAAKTIGSGLV